MNIKWVLIGVSMLICACKETPTTNNTESGDTPEKKTKLDVDNVDGFHLFTDKEMASFNQDDQLIALAQNMTATFRIFEIKYVHPTSYCKEWRHERDTFDPAKDLSKRAKKRLAKEFLEEQFELMQEQTLAYAKRYKAVFEEAGHPYYHKFKVAASLQKIIIRRYAVLRKASLIVDDEIYEVGQSYENELKVLKEKLDKLIDEVWTISRTYPQKLMKSDYETAVRFEKWEKEKLKEKLREENK